LPPPRVAVLVSPRRLDRHRSGRLYLAG